MFEVKGRVRQVKGRIELQQSVRLLTQNKKDKPSLATLSLNNP